QQVQPQPAVTEHRGHTDPSPGSASNGPRSSAGRESSDTDPDRAYARKVPEPRPMRPFAWRTPGRPDPRTCGKALVTRPLVAPRVTSRSASSGTRTVIEPDVVSMCTS